MSGPEFAEQYSPSERRRLLALLVCGGLLLVVACEWYFFPWLRWFASTSHCHQVMGVSGTTALWYGVFVGLPLHAAILAGVFLVPSALKSIRTRRFPPPGAKVLARTQVIVGWRAACRGYAVCASVVAILGMAVWGFFQAHDLDQAYRAQERDMSECAANQRFQWDVPVFGGSAPQSRALDATNYHLGLPISS